MSTSSSSSSWRPSDDEEPGAVHKAHGAVYISAVIASANDSQSPSSEHTADNNGGDRDNQASDALRISRFQRGMPSDDPSSHFNASPSRLGAQPSAHVSASPSLSSAEQRVSSDHMSTGSNASMEEIQSSSMPRLSTSHRFMKKTRKPYVSNVRVRRTNISKPRKSTWLADLQSMTNPKFQRIVCCKSFKCFRRCDYD